MYTISGGKYTVKEEGGVLDKKDIAVLAKSKEFFGIVVNGKSLWVKFK